ncbi:MAG: DNA translocase FtsK [Ruminococcus sp.]|nr:DNA translocase FtsK [Ruminococcus sp.]
MLIYEGIKNRGIAFSPLIKKLVDANDSFELDEHIDYISGLMRNYSAQYAKVPSADAKFPSQLTLGSVLYPADIFSDSIGFDRITETFGVERSRGAQSSAYVELPLSFDLGSSFNLLMNCPEFTNKAILRFTHHVIWSFLSFIPVTKVNVCVFDSEQRGNSIIPFLDFRKKSPDTFDQKIYTNQEAMVDRLKKINSQIDDFIQEKLGNRYTDILDYNINTPARAEPMTLLIIYDFPSGMDGRGIDLLTNILRNGNKCGVYTIICYNPNVTFSRYESIDERLEIISKYCASLDFKENNYCLLPYNLQVNIPDELLFVQTDSFIKEYVEKSEAIKKQGLSFRDIISKDLFTLDSSRSLVIPVGVGDGDSVVSITIGEGSSHHGLIAGATGSGKSTLLHTLIMSGMLHYSPDQLHLYLMDFKSGTEFKIYESVKLPHIRLLALDAMQEFGESILENLVSEMERRGALFKEAGQTSLKGYKAATGKPLPRILVIMDEFQILFNDSSNRKVAMNCAELTKRIVTEGRAFGIHLLMATQSTKVISDLTLSHGTIEQMRIRIGLKCGENDARYLFSDENDAKALTMMKGPIGTAVMNLDYTEQSNIGFRAAYCDEKTQREYLDLISKTFEDMPSSLQTFEGGRTTGLLDYFRRSGINATSSLPVQIHLGTLIKVAPPFAVTIDKKKKHNMLICGTNETMANTVANDYIISAVLNTNSTVYCIDGDKMVGDDISSAFYSTLKGITSRFKVAEDRSDIISFINEIYTDYLIRKKHNGDKVIFVVIKNLQFLDIVKTMFKGEFIDESEYLDASMTEEAVEDTANPFASVTDFFDNRDADDHSNVSEKVLKLIADGSGFGIHFVVSSLEYQTVRECMYYGENILTKFPERVIFSLGANDADNLIENVSVSGLRDNTVYFTDGVKNTFQMKPYVNPTNEELEQFFSDML